MDYCTCKDAIPVKSPNQRLYCGNCGRWINNDRQRKEKELQGTSPLQTEKPNKEER